ncbi:TetR/AcrR family transcriptional regulator [Bacillus sp. B15-48]|uniref:TetR/AcrR family transcriptional regulator n=1 Tax=Bacillus sp. B15-48 TaxID=1548601 RepID=UPI00193FCDE2|nr:TetR/AcrR family transcriptional regulator [Bacillus sp. B15-48]MBM4760923.1 TetR family transcriptional regulator [Bacillus sp. B15-48]
MGDRKKHVIKMAHQLFMEKGFQNTSIQDILEYSGISKGTFYNYFSSKNELLIENFKSLFEKLERKRDQLLIGQDPANIEVFTRQIELQMRTNRENHLISLFDEVYTSNDDELKEFLRQYQLRAIRWVYDRFIDLFGEYRKPYLFDCAIMFSAILHQNLKFHAYAYGANTSIHKVVSYSVARAVKIVEEVTEAKESLIQPDILEKWLPNLSREEKELHTEFLSLSLSLNKYLENHDQQLKCQELIRFIEEELFQSKCQRRFLIESALNSLKAETILASHPDLLKIEQLIHDFYNQ